MEEKWIVYVHINKLNNKFYVGITSRSADRRWEDGKGYSRQRKFYNAIKKYGWDNFLHIIIMQNLTESEAKYFEKEYIAMFDSMRCGYNSTVGGEGCLGYHHTQQAKDKMSAQRKGRALSEEWKASLSKARKGRKSPMLGKKMSQEQKDLIGESLKKFYQKEKESGKKIRRSPTIKVQCDGIIFDAIKDCADYYGIHDYVIVNWLKGKYCLPQKFVDMKLYFANMTPKYQKVKTTKFTAVCDGKHFDSVRDCAKYYGVSESTMNGWFNGKSCMPEQYENMGLKRYPVYSYKIIK